MPLIGERKRGREIEKRGGGERSLFEWSSCNICSKPRWVLIVKNKLSCTKCKRCSDRQKVKRLHGIGEKSPCWKGGFYYRYGYKYIWVGKNSIYYPMSSNNYVVEHRLVIAKSLKRCLKKYEIIHHKNGIRDDNRKENLELTKRGKHAIEHNQGYKDGFKRGYLDGKKERENKKST